MLEGENRVIGIKQNTQRHVEIRMLIAAGVADCNYRLELIRLAADRAALLATQVRSLLVAERACPTCP